MNGRCSSELHELPRTFSRQNTSKRCSAETFQKTSKVKKICQRPSLNSRPFGVFPKPSRVSQKIYIFQRSRDMRHSIWLLLGVPLPEAPFRKKIYLTHFLNRKRTSGVLIGTQIFQRTSQNRRISTDILYACSTGITTSRKHLGRQKLLRVLKRKKIPSKGFLKTEDIPDALFGDVFRWSLQKSFPQFQDVFCRNRTF